MTVNRSDSVEKPSFVSSASYRWVEAPQIDRLKKFTKYAIPHFTANFLSQFPSLAGLDGAACNTEPRDADHNHDGQVREAIICEIISRGGLTDFIHLFYFSKHPSNTLQTPLKHPSTPFKIIFFFRYKNGRKKNK